jgi:tetratricopeptide (TPR) repeat protein
VTKEKGDQMYLAEQYTEALSFYQKTIEYLSELDPDSYLQVKHLSCLTLLSLASTSQALGFYDYVILYCSQCIEIDNLNERAY